jgi:hypothetical protein
MKKRITKKTLPILIIDEILDCVPEEINDLEAYFSEGEEETLTQAA